MPALVVAPIRVKRGKRQAHGAGSLPFTSGQINDKIFNSRIEKLFSHTREAVNFVNEEHIAFF
jgi:hypothetical protein